MLGWDQARCLVVFAVVIIVVVVVVAIDNGREDKIDSPCLL